MDGQSTPSRGLGIVARILGYGLALALLVGAMVTGVWLLLGGTLLIILALWAGEIAPRARP